MTRFHLTALVLFASAATVQADDAPAAPAVTPALVQAAEEKYASEVAKAEAVVTKAEADLAKARKAAGETRLKAYKDRLAEVTKAGDFDKAIALKARIEQLEKEPESEPAKPAKRPRPKDTVKFGGHTYALIKDPATWHVAKQRCEEMGGHLAILETSKEAEFVAKLCTATFTWVGASDEEDEGEWKWVNGKKITDTKWISQDQQDVNHYLAYMTPPGVWLDATSVHRSPYVCEWDN